MANNFLQFSLSVPMKTKAELTWCAKTMVAFVKLLDDPEDTAALKLLGDLGQRVIAEGWEYRSFEFSIEPRGERGASLWIYAEESGDPDQVAAFLETYLQKFNPTGVVTFSWAYTCSKMRLNEFGGPSGRDRHRHHVPRRAGLGRRTGREAARTSADTPHGHHRCGRMTRRIATKISALLLAGLALLVWPGCWIVVSVHHASICGWGFSAWLCDEPWLTVLWHQVLTSASPLVSFALADAAYARWSRC